MSGMFTGQAAEDLETVKNELPLERVKSSIAANVDSRLLPGKILSASRCQGRNRTSSSIIVFGPATAGKRTLSRVSSTSAIPRASKTAAL